MDNLKLKILVLEDEKVLLDAITRKLQSQGHTVLGYASGREALEYLQNTTEELPDIIWLDYYLGDFNGAEFVAGLKKDPKTSAIPVVVISNSASPEKIERMKQLGVEDYLLKAENRLDDLVNLVTSKSKKHG